MSSHHPQLPLTAQVKQLPCPPQPSPGNALQMPPTPIHEPEHDSCVGAERLPVMHCALAPHQPHPGRPPHVPQSVAEAQGSIAGMHAAAVAAQVAHTPPEGPVSEPASQVDVVEHHPHPAMPAQVAHVNSTEHCGPASTPVVPVSAPDVPASIGRAPSSVE